MSPVSARDRMSPRLQFLLVPAPKAHQLPPGHHSLDRWPLHGYGVTPATDEFFRRWPHLHPLNLVLWDVQEAFPPYDRSPVNRPDQVPPHNTWPIIAFYYCKFRCGNAWAVFTVPDLLDNGSLVLGPCLFHQRHKHQQCPWRTTVVPLRRPIAGENGLVNQQPDAPMGYRHGPPVNAHNHRSVHFSDNLPLARRTPSPQATIVDPAVILDSTKRLLAATKEELAATRRSHEAAKQRTADRHERELQAAREQHEGELQAQQKEHSRAMQAIRNEHAKSLKKLRDQHANELRRTRERHARKLQEACDRSARHQATDNDDSQHDIEIVQPQENDLLGIKAELDKHTQALQGTLNKIKAVMTADI